MKVMKIMQDGGLIFCEQLQRDAKLHKKEQQIAKDFDKKYPDIKQCYLQVRH